MNGIKEEAFQELKTLIRQCLQDANAKQYKELSSEWKTQREVRRTILAAKLKAELSIGNKVVIENDTVHYEVIKIKRSKFVGKHPDTNVNWNIPIAMIEEIL